MDRGERAALGALRAAGRPSGRRSRAALAAALLALACRGADGPPNVVLVVLDDLGYGDLGSYGASRIRTPNLDRLAAEGMRFTAFYAAGPTCSPSRAALLTGRHPSELGIRFASQRPLPRDVPTLPEVLAEAGYTSVHVGKWHLGSARPPTAAGFDRAVRSGARYRDPRLFEADGARRIVKGHLTEVLTDRAIELVEELRDGPFFLNLWHLAPHFPHEPPERWARRYPATAAGRYAALVSHADEQIGRLVARLGELGLERRTLVLVTSDNGGGRKALATNGPLRGYKYDLFEGGIRVPLLARWVGTIAPGRETAALAVGMDLLPTLAELAGLAPPAGVAGRSLAGVLRGEPPAPRDEPLFWETKPEGPGAPARIDWAVRRGPWKLVRHHRSRAAELFDLERDPAERADRAAARPEIAAGLRETLERWRSRTARIAREPQRTEGEVTRSGARLRCGGGRVALAPDDRFRVGRGDLGFDTGVEARAVSTEQTLAEQPEAWRLSIAGDGRLRLHVRGPGEEPHTHPLVGRQRIVPGAPTRVAFAIYGRPHAGSVLRLYVDGRLEAESEGPREVAASDAPVWLCGDAAGASPFRGALLDPAFFSAALDGGELARLHGGAP